MEAFRLLTAVNKRKIKFKKCVDWGSGSRLARNKKQQGSAQKVLLY